jgi:hypothetical protein
LAREQAGIDIVLKVLNDKSLVATAAAAVEWAEENGAKWAGICREVVLATARLDALHKTASELLASCPDIGAARLVLGNYIGGDPTSVSVDDLIAAAEAQGVVNAADLKKVRHV